MIAPFEHKDGWRQTYYCLQGAEFVQGLGANRPVLCSGWAEANQQSAGVLRAISSGLLPFVQADQVIDVLYWADRSTFMVSPDMWRALGGV